MEDGKRCEESRIRSNGMDGYRPKIPVVDSSRPIRRRRVVDPWNRSVHRTTSEKHPIPHYILTFCSCTSHLSEQGAVTDESDVMCIGVQGLLMAIAIFDTCMRGPIPFTPSPPFPRAFAHSHFTYLLARP